MAAFDRVAGGLHTGAPAPALRPAGAARETPADDRIPPSLVPAAAPVPERRAGRRWMQAASSGRVVSRPLAPAGRGASQSGRALAGLRDLVFSGAYPPGERLSEVELAARLGLSRTPVRSALARLGQEGLLAAIPSGGWAVRAFSEADVADAIELRGVLEGTAARLAAERGAPPARLAAAQALLGEIDALLAPGVERADVEAYRGLNAAFHAQLAELPGSRILAAEIERAARLPFAEPSAFLSAQAGIPDLRASLAVGQAQHRAMLEAIEARQGARAEALAREHARLARRNLDAVLKDRRLVEKVPGLRLLRP